MGRYGARLWPEVSSPAARRVLVQLFNHYGSYTDFDFPAEIERIQYEHNILRLSEMRAEVRGSDIAKRLAGGPALLPDICEALPQPYAALYRIITPRTLEQHVDRVVRHLEWYLAPHQAPVLPFTLLSALAKPALLLLIALIGFGYAYAAGPLSLLLVLGGVIALMVLIRAGPALLDDVLANLPLPSLRCNATVLYHHLRRAYADAEEPKPGL